MNSLTEILIWCILQVTLLSLCAGLVYLVGYRRSPAVQSGTLFTSLILVVGLTGLAFSPWPRWSFSFPGMGGRAAQLTENSTHSEKQDDASLSRSQEKIGLSDSPQEERRTSFGTLLWRAFLEQSGQRETPAATAQGLTWSAGFLTLLLCGLLIGMLRIALGVIAVRRYRKESRAVLDPELGELRDILQAELGCPGTVDLCESPTLATPATIGWRRPVIILPVNWREWSLAERRAVLAHEIAHIGRHDFLTWAAAQVALVLHFYHPLVHWLTGRLRLEQELAADAAAARLAGGQQAYLTTLAGMALRQVDRPLAWPARTFLPTRGTFLRRIEMLRDTKLSLGGPGTRFRFGTVGFLLAIALVVAGLRGAGPVPQVVQAGPPGKDSLGETGNIAGNGAGSTVDQSKVQPLSLAYIPRDAVAIFAIRPSVLLAENKLLLPGAATEQLKEIDEALGFRVDQIEQLSGFFLLRDAQPAMRNIEFAGAIFRAASPEHAKRIVDGLSLLSGTRSDGPSAGTGSTINVESRTFSGQAYHVVPSRNSLRFVWRADDRTVILSFDEAFLRRMMVAGPTGAAKANWTTKWKDIASEDVAALVNLDALGPAVDAVLQANHRAEPSAFRPLWADSESLSLSVSIRDQFKFSGLFQCDNAGDANKVEDTLKAGRTLARNLLSQWRDHVSRSGQQVTAAQLTSLEIADTLLDAVTIKVNGDAVSLGAAIRAKEAAALATALIPAVNVARANARKEVSISNLKQISLAFHLYADKAEKFPPAVIRGGDKEDVPVSWRVAILPYIGAEDLYKQYNLNEPWDSETNRKVLAQMPSTFRDPNDPPHSTNTSYFVLSGPDTPFAGTHGVKFSQITDGLSYTLLVVEAKREVPWTKPEDIPYAANQPLPQLGGHYDTGFLAAFCDGSVRLIPKALDEKMLRALITARGQEPNDAIDRSLNAVRP